MVLVPFYRGAVVFLELSFAKYVALFGSRPLLSRSGCISRALGNSNIKAKFSSPFIEERLYFVLTR